MTATDTTARARVDDEWRRLFLPVGCWHFVEALDVSVTVSFTNFRWDNDFTAAYPRRQLF